MSDLEFGKRVSAVFPMTETITGVKHKKKLAVGGKAAPILRLAPFFVAIGAGLIMFSAGHSMAQAKTVVTDGGGGGYQIVDTGDPAPDNKPGDETDLPPADTDDPTTPSPEDTENPITPSPEDTENPTTPAPNVVIPVVTTTTPATDPPADPSTEPTVEPPTLSVSGTLWGSIGLLEADFTITPNDGTDIVTTYEITMDGGTVDSGSRTGSDSFSVEQNLGSLLSDHPDGVDGLTVNGSISYTLDGETVTDSYEQSISSVEASLTESSTTANYTSDGIAYESVFVFDYSSDSGRYYAVDVWNVDLVWGTMDGGSFIEDDYFPIWTSEDGESCDEITRADETGKVTFTYEDLLDFDALAETWYDFDGIPSDATHFLLRFSIYGRAKDKDDPTTDFEEYPYELLRPTSVDSTPKPVDLGSFTAPSIEYGHLWYWGEFNAYPSDPGFRLIELQCAITPNDATDITVDATVSSEMHSETYTWTGESWTGGSSAGTMALYKYAVESPPFLHSIDPGEEDDYWSVSLVMHYKLNGVEQTSEELVVPGSAVGLRSFRPMFEIGYKDGVVSMDLVALQADDPFTYSVSGIDGVYVAWYNDDNNIVGSEFQLYPGGGTLATVEAGKSYTLTLSSPLSPPTSGATQMLFRVVTTSPYTGDSSDGRHEQSNGPLESYSEMIPVSTSPSLGNYITGVGADHLPGHYHNKPTPDGFRATVRLDEDVVGQPDNTQPYGNGQTLEVSSVNLTRDGGTAQSISVDNVVFYPVESPYLTFDYHAPSGEQLAYDDYTLEVELSYNSPNENPPVVNLIDRDTGTFSVVPDELLGAGSFTYFAGTSLGGSIELLNGITSDELDSFEFTIWEGWSVITDSVKPNEHTIPPTGSSEDWIGFQLSSSADDEIPTFNESLEYYVTVRAVYKGEEYSTNRIPIEIGSAGTLTVSAYYRYQQDSGAPGVFDMSSLPATLGIDTELWIDVDDIPTGDEAEVEISLNQAQIVWTVGGAEQTETVTLSASDFGWDGDYHYYTGSVSGSVSVPSGATSAQLLCTVTASYDGKTGSDIATSADYELNVFSGNPFGSGSFTLDSDYGIEGSVRLVSGATKDNLSGLGFRIYRNGDLYTEVDSDYFTDGTDDSGDWVGINFQEELSDEYEYTVEVYGYYGTDTTLYSKTYNVVVPVPTLEDSADAWFDSFDNFWDDDESYWYIDGKIYVYVDPDFSTSPTITLNGVTLNWNTGVSTTIPGSVFTGPTNEDDGYWYFEISRYDPGVPAGVTSAAVTGTVSVTVGSESVTVNITDAPELYF